MTRERLHRRLHHISDIPRLHGVSPAIFDLDDSQNTERKQTEKRWQQREHVFDIGLLKVGSTRKKRKHAMDLQKTRGTIRPQSP